MVHRYLGKILLVSMLLISLVIILQDTTITGNVVQNHTKEVVPITLTILNSPPVIDPIGVVYYNATDYVNISPTVTDLNLDPLTYNYTLPLNDSGEWQTTESDWGYYNITVNVSDGDGGFDSENFTLVINGFSMNLTINGTHVILNWTDVQDASSYTIYSGTNETNLVQVDSGITVSQWSTTLGDVQFFRVGAVINEIILKSILIGYYKLPLLSPWNLVSIPLNLTSYELGQESVVGNPLVIFPKNTLKRIHRYNVTTDSFEMTEHIDDWGWSPAIGSENFNKLEPGRGYWFETNESATLYLIGYYPKNNITINLDKDYNVVGWFSLNSRRLGQESIYGNPIPVSPSNSVLIVHRYRAEYGFFESIMHFSGWGWWPFTRSESFQYMEPGRGYYFLNTVSSTWEHEP